MSGGCGVTKPRRSRGSCTYMCGQVATFACAMPVPMAATGWHARTAATPRLRMINLAHSCTFAQGSLCVITRAHDRHHDIDASCNTRCQERPHEHAICAHASDRRGTIARGRKHRSMAAICRSQHAIRSTGRNTASLTAKCGTGTRAEAVRTLRRTMCRTCRRQAYSNCTHASRKRPCGQHHGVASQRWRHIFVSSRPEADAKITEASTPRVRQGDFTPRACQCVPWYSNTGTIANAMPRMARQQHATRYPWR